ncbi:hypothetical protein C8J57DRAFT_1287131 [Mycena rebaudengoi]|nr:hypothetical protein C8J57DRAFT_1287131 [Mycena rebaudengoi]
MKNNNVWKSSKAALSCGNCRIAGDEANLKKCARCNSVRYCSKDCQREAWKFHKPWCFSSADRKAALERADAASNDHALSPGTLRNPFSVSFTELEERSNQWVKHHAPSLMSATIQALQLPLDITRTKTHIAYLRIGPLEDSALPASQFFRVIEVGALSMIDAAQKSSDWSKGIQLMKDKGDRDGEPMALMGIESPLFLSFSPFFGDFSKIPIIPNWRKIFIEDVESGKKYSKGACVCCRAKSSIL